MVVMNKSKYYKSLQSLLKKCCFSSKQAKQKGIPSRMLLYFHEKGILEKIARGIYRSKEHTSNISLDLEDLIMTVKSVQNGAICLLSALYYYGYSDQLMRQYWIAIPNKQWPIKRPHIKVVRMRNMTLGLKKIKLNGTLVNIFDKERTVLDCFKHLDKEVAIKALKGYLNDEKKDLNKLYKYSKNLKINIEPYVLTLTT